jgi:EmrB/QacA subfamily drug resistance transporter
MSQSLSQVKTEARQPADNDTKGTILALSAIIMSMLLAALDQTIVNPAMPRIVEELQGFSLFAWVSTAYLLTSTATIPIAGKLGDIFGRKPLLIIAVVLFLLGSLLSGAAPTMVWLVIFRALQGIGAGALQANVFTSIAELFPDPARRARWQGLMAAVFGLASVVGPALGGFITDNLAWRWVFYVNVPVGALAIIALIVYLPYNKGGGERKIDWWGAATITGAVVSLLLALTWGGQKEPKGYAWDSPQIIGLLATFVVLTGIFIWIESRVAEPILPLHLFASPAVRSITIMSFGLGFVMLGALYFIPMFVQVVQGQSAASSGAITTPLALAMVITNIVTGQFIARVGRLKIPMVAGAIVATLGVGLLALLNTASQPWEVTLFMIVIGIGLGFIMPTTTIAVQESIQRRDLGAGISSVQFFRSIGSTIGVAIIGTVVTNNYISNINATPGVSSFPTKVVEIIQEPQNLLNQQIAASLPPEITGAIRQALAGAIHTGFLISIAATALIVVMTLFVPSIRIKTARRAKGEQATEQAASGAANVGIVAPSPDQP